MFWNGSCSQGTTLDCNDNIACTTDSCDPVLRCLHTQDNTKCNDNLFCNGAETCASSGCLPGAPPSIDDGVACTTDSCDELMT